MSKTFYIAGKYEDIAEVFRNKDDNVVVLDNTSRSSENVLLSSKPGDFLVLGGGEDIDPNIYSNKPSKFSCPILKKDGSSSDRDITEMHLTSIAYSRDMNLLGVCRGMQLIWAANGGKLIQHVTNHNTDHPIYLASKGIDLLMKANVYGGGYDLDPPLISISSHHQMVDTQTLRCAFLAGNWGDNKLSKFYVYNDEYVRSNKEEEESLSSVSEPDIVTLGKRTFLMQGHPEWGHEKHKYTKLCKVLFNQYYSKGKD